MATAQDAITNLQSQALDAIKTGQETAVEAVQAWTQAVAKVTPSSLSVEGLPDVIGGTLGDPTAIVDSVYDFAAQLLTLNRKFVHQLLETFGSASGAKTEKIKTQAK